MVLIAAIYDDTAASSPVEFLWGERLMLYRDHERAITDDAGLCALQRRRPRKYSQPTGVTMRAYVAEDVVPIEDADIDEGRNGEVHPALKTLTLQVLVCAELAGEITELGALVAHAIVSMAEGSDVAADYLEMAEAVASSPEERQLVFECRSSFRLLQPDSRSAAQQCVIFFDRFPPHGLFKDLLLALCYLDREAIDAALREAPTVDGPATRRLVTKLPSLVGPHRRAVTLRPAG